MHGKTRLGCNVVPALNSLPELLQVCPRCSAQDQIRRQLQERLLPFAERCDGMRYLDLAGLCSRLATLGTLEGAIRECEVGLALLNEAET